ncbi:MAG: WD40 repeat domain-containing protein [Phycisphaerae bacterium]|nr:WD40 repeat domain-containing protein [Phycisphaerae bacterium]
MEGRNTTTGKGAPSRAGLFVIAACLCGMAAVVWYWSGKPENPSFVEKPIVILPAGHLKPTSGPPFQTSGSYRAVSFHPDSKQVVTSTGRGMDAWNIETGAHLWRIPNTGSLHSVRHLGDGGRLVTIEAPHIRPSLVVYDLVGKKQTLRLDACINAWIFSPSPDGSMVAMAAPEDPKRRQLTLMQKLQGTKEIDTAEEFRAKTTQNCVAAYDAKTGKRLWKIEQVARPTFTVGSASRKYCVEQVAFSPDQQILLCMDTGGSWNPGVGPDRSQRFSFWNIRTGVMLHDWVLPDNYKINKRDPAAITWSKDGKLVVIQAFDRQRKRFTTLCANPVTGKVLQEVAGLGVIVDGDRLVACDLKRKEVVSYSLETREELSAFKIREAPRGLTTVAASRDSRWLAGFYTSNLYVFDLQEKKQTAP